MKNLDNPLKIMISGSFSSGKTTFIQTISDIQLLPVEWVIPLEKQVCAKYKAVAMDFGRLDVNSNQGLYLFATPGARSIRSIWQNIGDCNEMFDGVVILLDSVDVSKFVQEKYLLDFCNKHVDVPYIIAANKQDHPDAWSTEDIQIALRLKEPIMPCCAKDVECVKRVMVTLLEKILAQIDEAESLSYQG